VQGRQRRLLTINIPSNSSSSSTRPSVHFAVVAAVMAVIFLHVGEDSVVVVHLEEEVDSIRTTTTLSRAISINPGTRTDMLVILLHPDLLPLSHCNLMGLSPVVISMHLQPQQHLYLRYQPVHPARSPVCSVDPM